MSLFESDFNEAEVQDLLGAEQALRERKSETKLRGKKRETQSAQRGRGDDE